MPGRSITSTGTTRPTRQARRRRAARTGASETPRGRRRSRRRRSPAPHRPRTASRRRRSPTPRNDAAISGAPPGARAPGRRSRARPDLVDQHDAEPERQRRPEVVSVKLQRLRDELAHRPVFRRKRRWQRLLLIGRTLQRPTGAASRPAVRTPRRSASELDPAHRSRSRPPSPRPPARRRAHTRGERRSPPSPRRRAPEPPTRALVPIGANSLRERVVQPREQLAVGQRDRGDERPGGVAVDRLGAEHGRQGLEPAGARDADVEDGVRPLLGKRARGATAASTGPTPQTNRPAPPPARAPARSRRRPAST